MCPVPASHRLLCRHLGWCHVPDRRGDCAPPDDAGLGREILGECEPASCGSSGGRHLASVGGGRLRLAAPARLDVPSCCKSQTAAVGMRLTPAFQQRSTSLRFATAPDPVRAPVACASFRSSPPRRRRQARTDSGGRQLRRFFEDVEQCFSAVNPIAFCIPHLLHDAKAFQSFDGTLSGGKGHT